MLIETLPQSPPDPSAGTSSEFRRPLTFRSSKIIYYGPHACDNCGGLICRMGHEFGGNAFTYPGGPIYPNTEWHPHVCDPKLVAAIPKPTAVGPSIGPECKGSFLLQTACGHCLRCKEELSSLLDAAVKKQNT